MKQVRPQAKENHARVFLRPRFPFPLSWVLTTRQQQTRCWQTEPEDFTSSHQKKTCEQLFPFYGWESRGIHGCHLAESELCVLLDSRESLSSPQPAPLGKNYNSEYKNVTLNKIGIFRSKNLLTLLCLSSVSTD